MMGPSSTYFPRSFSPKNAGLETRAGKAIEVARARLWMATIVFIFCLVAVFGRLVDLTLLRSGEDIDYLPKDQVFASGRADIVDRNGLLLATTLVTKSLFAIIIHIINANELYLQVKPGGIHHVKKNNCYHVGPFPFSNPYRLRRQWR